MQITDRTKELFKLFAEDADNWSGTPFVGGNVGSSKEDRGNITQMKIAGLITTFTDGPNCTWIEFTPKGREYAESLGIKLTLY